jgi:acetyl-CoA decarbonylase/synthase complex subunit delta
MENLDLSFAIKEKVRKVEIGDFEIGSDSSVSFMSENGNNSKSLIAIEIPYLFNENIPEVIKSTWNVSSMQEAVVKAMKSSADLISVKFNINSSDFEKEKANIKQFLQVELSNITKPLILRGANNEVDEKLIPFLAEYAPKECIIAFAEENTYEKIVPSVIKNNHVLVLRTPIDINIAKELNILSIDKGLSPEKILIDPDMGGLGYGIDYGYSIIERIRQAAFDGDTMLNMPIIAFIGEETYRTKEAKADSFDEYWGNYENRATMWEISGASAMLAAGANIVVLWNLRSVDTLKGLL